jgi:hypothetical protein
MNAAKMNTRSSNVPAVVTALVAAWFVLASGMAFAETAQPAAPAANPVTLTPKGTMKLTVVAARPATQVALTPAGTMKLTIVAKREQAARVQTASAREASRS